MLNKSILNNGITVITNNDDNAKTVTISYVLKCGSYSEDENNMGIAHFVEHMLFKGTTKLNSIQISQAIEGVGGILNAETSFEHTRYYCTLPSEHWKTGLDVLSDMIWFNTIPEEEFDREKQVVLEELKMYNDDAGSKVIDLLFKRMNQSYINRQYVGGTNETVSKITRDQMIEFIDKFYVPQNMVVIATGKINHEELCKLVDEYSSEFEFNDITEKESNFVPDKLAGEDLIENKDIVQSHLCWGIFGPKPNDKEYVIGEVIATLLGGNSSSRLYQIIREQKGLAYTVSMDIDAVSDVSMFIGYVGLDGNKINDVKNVLIDELESLKTEIIDEEELQRAKNYLKGTLVISLEKTSSQNSYITNAVINKMDFNYETFLNEIDEITANDIKEFANKYFDEENICFTQVIPKKQ